MGIGFVPADFEEGLVFCEVPGVPDLGYAFAAIQTFHAEAHKPDELVCVLDLTDDLLKFFFHDFLLIAQALSSACVCFEFLVLRICFSEFVTRDHVVEKAPEDLTKLFVLCDDADF